ncbi:hypothetical protein V2G26_012525 [Clonostachys chloroleuca]|uniref:Nucleotide-diphospho-sugar transferase domain-containing protein n=1 Tax=Clonostachys chloroleuca TaxID=1926264 RepID=A0AA35Q3T8_9HYPO|nr:unnamed protein product [Clonostachys chloroleuca]
MAGLIASVSGGWNGIIRKRRYWSMFGIFAIVLFFGYSLFILSTEYDRVSKIINFLKPNKNSEQENNEEVHLDPFIAELQAKYKPTLHRIDNSTFVTREGYKYTVNDTNHYFTEPLGKRLLILDADSRLETEPGHMLAPPPLTHEDIKRGTAGMMNHFLYAMIHGYDYRLVKSPKDPSRHGTWSKVPLIREALKTHDFVVFLDSDANFQYYNLPYEWLMNLWGVNGDTLAAMPEDPNSKVNQDSNGWVLWNTGFVTAQQSERTQDMFDRWDNCPSGERYKECKHWAFDWAHEQAAFGAFVRYEYEVGKDLIAISCMDGNGASYIGDKKCGGVFVSHHWGDKDRTIKQLYDRLDGHSVEELHRHFHENQETYYINAEKHTYPIKDLTI